MSITSRRKEDVRGTSCLDVFYIHVRSVMSKPLQRFGL